MQKDNEKLEFEKIQGTDLRVSKPFQTKGKDRIRVAFATGRTAIIMSDRKSKFPDVMVDVPEGIHGTVAKKGFWAKVWDFIKGLVKGIDVGGGVKCKLSVEIIRDGLGNMIGCIVKTVCTFD